MNGMAPRLPVASLVFVTVLALPSAARASEAVRLVVDATPCATEETVRAELDALGARIAPAEGGLARTFDVRVAKAEAEAGYDARLVVRDFAQGDRERSIRRPSCAEATRSAALLIALALDERGADAASTLAPDPEPSSPWPTPAEAPRVPPGTRDSGGVALLGGVGLAEAGGGGMMTAWSGRALAVARVGHGLRVGGTLAAASEGEDRIGKVTVQRLDGGGIRAGAVAGWGAPWDDSIFGLGIEAGLSYGWRLGSSFSRVGAASQTCLAGTTDPEGLSCYDDARGRAERRDFVSPYGGLSIFFQVPLRLPVRPVAAWTFLGRGGPTGAFQLVGAGELGLVWQAW